MRFGLSIFALPPLFAVASCGSSAPKHASLVVGESLGPPRSEVEASCRALCAIAPDYAGSTRAAPSFALHDEHGKSVSFEQLRGKVVIINLWLAIPEVAPDMPELAKLWKLLRARPDVAFVSIANDGLPERALTLLQQKVPLVDRYPVLFDPTGKTAQDFGTFQFPETWFVDPGGIMRARIDGARKWSALKVGAFLDTLRDGKFCPLEIDEGWMSGLGSEYCDGTSEAPPRSGQHLNEPSTSP